MMTRHSSRILAACLLSASLLFGGSYAHPGLARDRAAQGNSALARYQDRSERVNDQSAQSRTKPADRTYLHWPLTPTGAAYADIDGHRLWQYVEQQAQIGRRYRDQGHPQFWGRIAGTSADVEDQAWLLDKYRRIGLSDVHPQPIAFLDPQWMADSWSVVASENGQTLDLASAQPVHDTVSTDGRTLDLPVVYVGLGSEADYAGRDVRGKAVLFVRENVTYNLGSKLGPTEVVQRAVDHGAAAIFGTDLRGGNVKAFSYPVSATVPAFNLGTKDALAVRDLIGKAPVGEPPHLKIRLAAKWVAGQKSALVWGTLPGTTDETIYVIAHRDGWFDAAGDNASGIAVMLGIAEHFAKMPMSQRRRTMVFVGLEGHHNWPNGEYGNAWLYENRAKLFGKTALMINPEHPSELLTHGGVPGRTEEVIPMQWYTGGPSRPELKRIAHAAYEEFGVPIWAEQYDGGGDLTPFVGYVPGLMVQSTDFIYFHTDGDTPDIVPWTGLEAGTRAYARIIDEVNTLPLSALKRPEDSKLAYKPPFKAIMCAEWIREPSVACKPGK